jgi:hypothetical protein
MNGRWWWLPDPSTSYSVWDAYQMLTSQDIVTLGTAEDLIWHRLVPTKVFIFVWRPLCDRLPTKSNLATRGILSPDLSLLCDGMWRHWDSSSFIPLVPYFWVSLGVGPILDWLLNNGCRQTIRSFRSVHIFSWRSSGSAVIFAVCLACLCLG